MKGYETPTMTPPVRLIGKSCDIARKKGTGENSRTMLGHCEKGCVKSSMNSKIINTEVIVPFLAFDSMFSFQSIP